MEGREEEEKGRGGKGKGGARPPKF